MVLLLMMISILTIIYKGSSLSYAAAIALRQSEEEAAVRSITLITADERALKDLADSIDAILEFLDS